MTKITTATPEQWDAIEQLRLAIMAEQNDRISLADATLAVRAITARMKVDMPEVVMAPSPRAAVQACCEAHGVGRKQVETYWSIWWRAWAGWYAGAEILGVQFDADTLRDLTQWAKCVPFVAMHDGLWVVSDNPVAIHWQDAELHREDGPSVEYADGWALWSLDGVRVNEQIVMHPETQTIEQIADEENEEVRRICIDRYGWLRYLQDTDSTIIDERRNDIEATYEILADTQVGQRLITHCPSTGRRYSLALPGERVSTCEEAQQRLWGDRGVTIIGRT